MKRLRRIQLINWHRFTHHTLAVDGHLLLMGDNGSGKSTILDALQVGLVGNVRAVRLNLAANEGGDRSLASYVLGVVGGGTDGQKPNTLRKNATAYILLEFDDSETGETFVLGTVIDAHRDGRSPDKEHFIARPAQLEDCPCVDARMVPRTVREFKREVRQHKTIRRYARVEEYQQAVLRLLGGLDPEFFRLFVSGMAFRKIRHLRDFVYDFLLPEAGEVQVVSLRDAAERYRQLHELSREAGERIELLDRIVANAQSTEESQQEANQLRALIDRAKWEERQVALHVAQANRARFQRELAEAEETHRLSEAAHQTARETALRLRQELAAHGKHGALLAAESRVERLADQIRHENRDSERLQHALRASRSAWAGLVRLLEESTPAPAVTSRDKDLRWRDDVNEVFGPDVVHRLEDFDALAADCLSGEIPPSERRAFVHRVAEDWPAIGHWLQSRQFQVETQLNELQAERREAHAELIELRQGHRPVPPGLVRLQDRLQAVGISSVAFCEVIQVTDARWQEPLEAVLGLRRYDLLVDADAFDEALAIFQSIDDPESVPFGLVDGPRLMAANGSPMEDSLAGMIETDHPLARRYADAILGRVVAVEEFPSADWLRARAATSTITSEGWVVGEYAVRRLSPAFDQQPWPLGGDGVSQRRQAVQSALKELRLHIRLLTELRERIRFTFDVFDRGRRGPELLAEDYELPARLRTVQHEYREAREEQAAIRESDLGQLRQWVEEAELAERQTASELKLAYGRQCVAEQSLHVAEKTLASAAEELTQLQAAYADAWPAEEEIRLACERRFAERNPETPLKDLIRTWAGQLQILQENFGRRHDDGVRLRTEYNNRFLFAADCLAADVRSYEAERARWVESELPDYESRLAAARETARQVLEEEVIHRLRERLGQVERQFRELNRALEGLNFSGRSYRFTYRVRREFQAFHEMVVAAERVANEPLHQSPWHAEFAEGPLKDLLEDVLGGGGNRALAHLERCTDYRAYFDYDIEITEADGSTHAFSHVAGSGSGGETQTPYYVAMLASMARLYRAHGGADSRAALVAFDEPFQKMDESNIEATLRLAHRLGLQVLLAAPKDRAHQLLPAMGTATCLLVLREGNRVLVEPFQRLGEEEGAEEQRPQRGKGERSRVAGAHRAAEAPDED